MRTALTLSLFAFTMFQHQCNLGSPEKVTGQFEEKLHPYFTRARAKFVPEQNAIVGLTCIEGAGPELVRQAADFLRQQKDLRMLRYAPMVGGPRYKSLVLAFDSAWIFYDVDSGQMYQPSLPPGYDEVYRRECGLDSAALAAPESTPDPSTCIDYAQDDPPNGPLHCVTKP